MDPYDFKSLHEMLNKNKHLIESFFGKNTFDHDFLKRVMENGDITEQPKPVNEGSTSDVRMKQIPMDMIQRKHELLFIFEIPGLKTKDDVKIKVVGSSLLVEGEVRRNYTLNNTDKTKYGRTIGTFSKRVQIPVIYDNKRIRAKYNQGLLEVRIPILKQHGNDDISVHFSDE